MLAIIFLRKKTLFSVIKRSSLFGTLAVGIKCMMINEERSGLESKSINLTFLKSY